MTASCVPPISMFVVRALIGLSCLVPSLAWTKSTAAADSLTIKFDSISAEAGLRLSITAVGNSDGETTFSNKNGEGVEDAQQYVSDVSILAGSHPLKILHNSSGWTVKNKPRETLTVSYRLPPSGPTKIDAGAAEQFRPLIHEGLFHLIGNAALLLPSGRAESDPLELNIDAANVVGDGQFVSSFGPGTRLRGLSVTRGQVASALYLGGPIKLSLHNTATGQVGVVYSAMDPGFREDDLRSDVLSIIETERKFFSDGQAWYLVSLNGGLAQNPSIFLGGGTGLTNSFAMFALAGMDFSNTEQRKQFRWVLAHEYFHQWNGLTLRVASRPLSKDDDAGIYWFSEGVTEFYSMRLLTRAGLQSPETSLGVLNNKLFSYAANKKRGISAKAAGALFWTDPDGEQIPYLRGYLAAWYVDLALGRSSEGARSLDTALRALVERAKGESKFRINNSFLASYLTQGLTARDANRFRAFAIDGREMPLDSDSFRPCLEGEQASIAGNATLQFHFADPNATSCFQH